MTVASAQAKALGTAMRRTGGGSVGVAGCALTEQP
jgi:hypothetical protein